ncbi:carboxymuconolactone decarboxylase family protein [Paraburkholderia sp. CNPSo 3155]|uniref:carboxymuconolactone decarboxylase family protein n=1 Tax=Paraburkholderia atlantica TaxID=2654982 RepID=UPI00128C117B|nr:carboxymuconolactone decarboxylase family protein [Paraburkholderia atlantica]MPW09002.1 carboxymuconolactone decarboxylase family protein [Paraburkholderia atlantica]
MPRVSEPDPSSFSPELRQLFNAFTGNGAHFADQFSVLSHVGPAVEHLPRMLLELKARNAVPFRYIEISIVVVSLLNDCDYCVRSHAPRLAVEGVSEAGARNLLDYADHPELDAVDKLVVEYAIAVTNAPQRIRDNVFERLREHFSEAQIVELTLRISLCGFFNRFNQALQIGEDPTAVHPA